MLKRRAASWSPVTLVAMIATATACNDVTAPSHLTYLPGSWQWVSSRDVNSEQVHTPSSEGFTARLEFMAETERDGTFVYARDGVTPVEGEYDIGFEDAPGNDFIRLSRSIDFLTEFAWISVGTDTLRLGGVFELGYNSVYARIPE